MWSNAQGLNGGGGGVMHCDILREGHRSSVVMSKHWNFLMINVGRYGLQKKKQNIDKNLLWACLDEGEGPQNVCDLTCSGGVKKKTCVYIQSYKPSIPGCTFSRYLMAPIKSTYI